MNRLLSWCLTAALLLSASGSLADTFGSGANSFEIEFVAIGNPGNPPDTTDRPVTDGAVAYRYRIGKYEISEQMIDQANVDSAAAGNSLNNPLDGRGENMPATAIGWFEAARLIIKNTKITGNASVNHGDGGIYASFTLAV